MTYEDLKAWIVKEFWNAAQVAQWVRSNFHARTSFQGTSAGAASNGLPIRLNSVGQIDTSFLSVDSPLTVDMTIASGDYLIMPRLEISSGVTLTLEGELVLIA